jgi:hypothetical protein
MNGWQYGFHPNVRFRAIFMVLILGKYVVGCSCVDSKTLKHTSQ